MNRVPSARRSLTEMERQGSARTASVGSEHQTGGSYRCSLQPLQGARLASTLMALIATFLRRGRAVLRSDGCYSAAPNPASPQLTREHRYALLFQFWQLRACQLPAASCRHRLDDPLADHCGYCTQKSSNGEGPQSQTNSSIISHHNLRNLSELVYQPVIQILARSPNEARQFVRSYIRHIRIVAENRTFSRARALRSRKHRVPKSGDTDRSCNHAGPPQVRSEKGE